MPIRDEDVVFSPAVNVVELGHEFITTVARVPTDARFYIHDLPAAADRGQTYMAAIYPAGLEDQSGPIQRVLIPVRNAFTTGGTLSSGAATAADALLTPSSSTGITLSTSIANSGIIMSFAINQYPHLAGKRILGCNLVYGGSGTDDVFGAGSLSASAIMMSTSTNVNPPTPSALFGRFGTSGEINRNKFGEINQFWTANSPTTVSERMPWIYTQLQRLDTAATRLWVLMTTGTGVNSGTTTTSTCYIFYAALEVIYCEEKRTIVGAAQFGTTFAGVSFGKDHVLGVNILPLRDLTYTANPTMAAGQYLLTVSSADVGDLNDSLAAVTSDYATLNAVRELYQIPSHPGIRLDIPFPVEERIGDVFTSTVTHVLPQLSLHASGGTLTEPHVYGRQAAAQVYGVNTATQEIYDDVVGVATVFPQVRYVARRFGDTTVPLTLTGTGSLAASTASITVAEFDALTEIIDGWKEVTLRFAVPPTMGTLATPEPSWTWSATAETGGNRWEVLAACAPAVSGVPGNLYNLVPAANQLYSATYQPPGGSQAELTWMPQGIGSPYVSGATEDDSTDAFLIFSQDPPTITGVALTSQTQTVTGLGFDCGSLPCCIPSGISYQRITWPQVPGGGMDLPGTSGSYASTPDTAVLDIVGDIDLRADVTLDNWNLGTDQSLIGKWNTVGNQRSYLLVVSTGTLFMVWSNNGTTVLAEAPTTPPVPDINGRLAVRATLDVNNGAAGHTVTFYTAPSINGVWTQLGAPVVTAGVTSIFSSTADLLAGADTAGTADLLAGTVHAAEVYNGIAGTAVANPNFSIQPTGTTTFTDAAGRIWTLFGSAAITHTGVSTLGVAALELQRWDYLQPDFETIMLTTDYSTIGFNDFEARVGVPSVYRIRALNIYNFAGAWSTQVTGSIPTPGVTGGCSDQTGALIFTSNADQTGASNAAYVMQWESDPAETFDLPEADQVVFQAMYGRDGVVAFHGTERGLETFSRVLLIHAAAISPIRLADVKTLRDLAWADLPYICVRDDIADRWFANVQVPTVNARHNRTTYLARVDIRELTRTPFAVDP